MQQLILTYIIQIVPLEMITRYSGIVMVFHKHFQMGGLHITILSNVVLTDEVVML
jgi:hypothetical protein